LAAGESKRLRPLTEKIPKCLLPLNGDNFISFQIKILKKYNLKINIVIGHGADKVKSSINENVNFIYNPEYEKNNIVSLKYALTYLQNADSILIVNSDVIFHPRILDKILNCDYENAVCVDNVKKLGEEEMKVKIENGKVLLFRKNLSIEFSAGEYIGIAKFSGKGLKILREKVFEMVNEGKVNEWYEEAFNEITRDIDIIPVFTDGLPWTEVDTFEDYVYAKEIYKKEIT